MGHMDMTRWSWKLYLWRETAFFYFS